MSLKIGHQKFRVESLSDLIFGLALSIGALTLIGKTSTNSAGQILVSTVYFAFSFLILISVWVRYSRIMAVLPVETIGTLALNIALLFFVAIEPYFFNLLQSSNTPGTLNTCSDLLGSSSSCFEDFVTTTFALDIGAIRSILASLANILTVEEKGLVPSEVAKRYKSYRNSEIVAASVFFISVAPIFWTVAVQNTPIRFYLWAFTFLVIFIVRKPKVSILSGFRKGA